MPIDELVEISDAINDVIDLLDSCDDDSIETARFHLEQAYEAVDSVYRAALAAEESDE